MDTEYNNSINIYDKFNKRTKNNKHCVLKGGEITMIEENNFDVTEEPNKRKKLTILLCACAAGIFIIIVLAALYKNCIIVSHKWVDATCEQPKTCERCGLTEGNILPHTLSQWIVDREPTCATQGEQHYVCSVCGKTISEEIDAKGHNFGEWVTQTAATCSAAGEKVQTCTICGYQKTESIPQTEHNFTDDKITTYATLYSQGQKTQKCTLCGSTIDIAYSLSDTEKANINLVMNGIIYSHPSKTVGDAFNAFFSNPTWYALEDGKYVYCSGGCTYDGEPATAIMGFEVYGNNFELGALNIDGTTYEDIVSINIFLNTVFGY